MQSYIILQLKDIWSEFDTAEYKEKSFVILCAYV